MKRTLMIAKSSDFFSLLSVTQDDFEHKMGDIICAIGSESSARSAISQSSDCYDIYKLGLPLPGVYDLKSLGPLRIPAEFINRRKELLFTTNQFSSVVE